MDRGGAAEHDGDRAAAARNARCRGACGCRVAWIARRARRLSPGVGDVEVRAGHVSLSKSRGLSREGFGMDVFLII